MVGQEPSKVLVVGYYGFRNMGDEAVLTSLIEDLRSRTPGIDITVVSDAPHETSAWYSVRAIHWRDIPALIEAMADTDLVLVGGGGLFNSYLEYQSDRFLTQAHSLFSVYIFSVPVLAYLMAKPCVICGVGASRIQSADAQRHVRMAVALASACTVRDPGSKEILEKLGVEPGKVQVSADPAFRLVNDSASWARDLLDQMGIPRDRPVIGVVLRNWAFHGESDITETAAIQALQVLVQRHRASLLFIPFDTNPSLGELSNDQTIIKRVVEGIGMPDSTFVMSDEFRPSQLSAVIAECTAVIGMRLHSVILSIRNATPCIGLVYDPKVLNIMTWAGLQEFALDIDSISAERLLQMVERVLAERERLSARLGSIAKEMREQATLNLETAWRYAGTIPALRTAPEIVRFVQEVALKQTRLLVALEKQTMIRDLAAILRRHVEAGEFQVGAGVARELSSLESHVGEWHYLVAFCLHNGQLDLKSALASYDQAEALGFSPFWICYNRGALHVVLGQVAQARRDLIRAAELDPTHEGVRRLLAGLPECPE